MNTINTKEIVQGSIVKVTESNLPKYAGLDADSRFVVVQITKGESDAIATCRDIREHGNPWAFPIGELERENDIIVPVNKAEARETVMQARKMVVFDGYTEEKITALPKADFMKYWCALNVLCGAHPDDVPSSKFNLKIRGVDAWLGSIDDESGWPLDLIPFGQAAHKRTDLRDEELYAYEVGQAGTLY